MNSRRGSASRFRAAGWLLALTVAVPAITAADMPSAATFPPWSLKLVIHYLPPATNRSQYDVVLAWGDQSWFFGGTNVTGPGKPEAERIKNGVPQSTVLPSGAHSWITAASAPSPSNIWAVTFLGGSVLNWNGSACRAAPGRLAPASPASPRSARPTSGCSGPRDDSIQGLEPGISTARPGGG
ncbi:MAG TPA: hypothetical protein VF506_05890 [Streptosporangiaceae bacterium]